MENEAKLNDCTPPEAKHLLGDIFSIQNVMKLFPNAEFAEGVDKHGTTAARVLREKSFWIIESPRYKNGIKCWLSQENSNVGKEIVCETVGDLVSDLNIT
jgi:hypothetical protein